MTQNFPHNPSQSITRRDLLCVGGGTAIISLAGCGGYREEEEGNPNQTPTSEILTADPVFENITFEGKNIVIELADEHSVTRINLIDPDGTTFAEEQVAEGERSIEIQILSLSDESYQTGEYKIVATSEDSTQSITVDLSPQIRITEITPQLSGDELSTGKLIVRVENTGSGPTWIYNIGYKGAPFEDAPQVIENIADTSFEQPTNTSSEIIHPNEKQKFLKRRGVLIIDDNDAVSCNGDKTEITAVVQTVHGNFSQKFEARLSGGYNIRDPGSIQHPCKEVSITLID